jgi:hypothetical protein
MFRFTIRDVLSLTVVVGMALTCACNSRAPKKTGSPATAQDEKLRQTKWNVEVLFRMDEMERAGKSAEEIESYRLKNYDKPPKDFKLND